MGLFDVFDGIKKIGKSIGNTVSRIGKAVSSVGRPILRTVGKGFNFIKKIPVIGEMVENSPVGYGIEKGLKIGNDVVDIADSAGKGNFVDAGVKAGRAAGFFG